MLSLVVVMDREAATNAVAEQADQPRRDAQAAQISLGSTSTHGMVDRDCYRCVRMVRILCRRVRGDELLLFHGYGLLVRTVLCPDLERENRGSDVAPGVLVHFAKFGNRSVHEHSSLQLAKEYYLIIKLY